MILVKAQYFTRVTTLHVHPKPIPNTLHPTPPLQLSQGRTHLHRPTQTLRLSSSVLKLILIVHPLKCLLWLMSWTLSQEYPVDCYSPQTILSRRCSFAFSAWCPQCQVIHQEKYQTLSISYSRPLRLLILMICLYSLIVNRESVLFEVSMGLFWFKISTIQLPQTGCRSSQKLNFVCSYSLFAA